MLACQEVISDRQTDRQTDRQMVWWRLIVGWLVCRRKTGAFKQTEVSTKPYYSLRQTEKRLKRIKIESTGELDRQTNRQTGKRVCFV